MKKNLLRPASNYKEDNNNLNEINQTIQGKEEFICFYLYFGKKDIFF